MLKNGVKAQWIVLSHVLLNASQISCESMGVKGINSLIKVFDWKNIINMTYSFKYHNYWRLAESWDNSKWTWLLDSWTNDLQKTNSLHLKKKDIQEVSFGHYRAAICKWDWQCPSQSFIQFKLQDRSKKGWKKKAWSSISYCALITGSNWQDC